MKGLSKLFLPCLVALIFTSCEKVSQSVISGELKKWHPITLTFEGPETHELDTPNPFKDYRLNVKFIHEKETFIVPGFYNADGNSGETSADSGKKWQVRFTPNHEGEWTYKVSFRQGENLAISDEINEGNPVFFDGEEGSFLVKPTDKTGRDFRGKGKLKYVGKRYLQFQETGEFFLKAGADSPENFLAYEDFDGTFYNGDKKQRMGEAAPKESLHTYQPHLQDWKEGGPTWQNGKGKAMIGALNYLAGKGMNSVYFLTLNIAGDGEDVWPYTDYDERYRFDCSKLDQWEKVFSHMDSLGLMLHVVMQETENELLLDSGNLGIQRKLYYRELIARFSHHLAITWNMGEENGHADFTPEAQTLEQQKAMVKYFKEHDPYQNFVVIHSHAAKKYRYAIFDDLLGNPYLDGPSLQLGNPLDSHHETLTWLEKSKNSGKQWVINIDEIGPNWRGADPDDREDLNNQDSIRSFVLWANLMAGGGGVEWYFGYQNHDNDLNCEDWRSRDRLWDYTRFGVEFFQKYLPFSEMVPNDSLTNNSNAYCFEKSGDVYAVYLPTFAPTSINLTQKEGTFEVKWYDPKKGGELLNGTITSISGNAMVDLGEPPENLDQDWVMLIVKQ